MAVLPGENLYKTAAIVFLALFIFGAGIRVFTGSSVFYADLSFKAAGKDTIPGTKTAEDTAVSFYMLIDRGEYEAAYRISIEPDWSGEGKPLPYSREVLKTSSPFGITGKEEFIDRLTLELGERGIWLKLNNIRTVQADCENSGGNPAVPGWLRNAGAEDLRQVCVHGDMLGACTIYSWETSVPVARFSSGYKVVLPGTKMSKTFYYQSWFSHLIKISDLRSGKD